MFNKLLFDNRAVYGTTWKNIVDLGRPQTTICSMRIACWILKVTNTHPGYVPLTAFPLQQLLLEGASILREYVYCLSYFYSQAPFREFRQ